MRCVAQKQKLIWMGFILTFLFLPVNEGIAQTCIAPPADLVSWWPGDSDASDIQDGNDGVLTNGALAGVPGKVDGAFSFDGMDDFIRVTTSTNLNPGSLTIDSWVNPSSFGTGNLAMIVSKFSNSDIQRSYFLSVDNGGFGSPGAIVIGFITAAGTTTFVSGPTIPLNQFTHVAMTYDAATSATKIYINAVEVSKTKGASGHVFPSGSIFTSTTDVSIGAQIGGFSLDVPTRFWDGILDEIEIFNRALSAAEIQDIFNAGSAGKCKVLSVTIDIKPGSDPNSINLCSNGAVPIAILGSATFDVNDVNTETLRFAEASVKVVGKKDPHSLCSYEDVNGDFITDLVCHYVTTDIAGIDGESTSATLNGELLDGRPIQGTDSVNIVKDTCN